MKDEISQSLNKDLTTTPHMEAIVTQAIVKTEQNTDTHEASVPEMTSDEAPEMPAPQTETTPEDARYESNVTQYAQYETHEDVYSKETQKSLSYAARSPFARFFLDIIAILVHPAAFWRGQDLHPATLGQLHWPHLTVLILLRTAAVFVGGILQPDAIMHQVIIQAITQGLLIFLLIWTMALIVTGISAISGGGFRYTKALRFVGYSITPLIFVGLIRAIPLPWIATVCDLLAMPWAFVVMGAGVLPYLKIKPENAPTTAALMCGILLCLWGAMPMLIPFLLGLKL